MAHLIPSDRAALLAEQLAGIPDNAHAASADSNSENTRAGRWFVLKEVFPGCGSTRIPMLNISRFAFGASIPCKGCMDV